MTQQNANKLFMDIARRFAKESHCVSYKVAAIAVKDQRIVSTGINGSVAGAENCDDHFQRLYDEDMRNKDSKLFFSLKEWVHTCRREEHHDYSLAYEIHAEQNMVATAAREGISLTGCDVYITTEPCDSCLKLLAAIRPKTIYYGESYDKTDNTKMYEALEKLGIRVEKIEEI